MCVVLPERKLISAPENLFSVENLYGAYLKCRKGKRGKINTRGFEVNLVKNLNYLSYHLQNRTYEPSRSVLFYVSKPKFREIFAADFGDRVVHRLLVDALEPEFDKKFISDSFACRRDKGTHSAVDRLREFLDSLTNFGKWEGYYLQLDIRGFFMEIQKDILNEILRKKVDEKLLWLSGKILYNNPINNYILKGKPVRQGILPPHKTLFHPNPKKGIPIGNLTSQFFANVYLNHLDQFCKRRLGITYYLRYVDDFILLDSSRERLLDWREKIITYLREELDLQLKDSNKDPISVYKGIDFLGYFCKPSHTLVRRRVIKNFKTALAESLPPRGYNTDLFQITKYHKSLEEWKTLQSRVNSYMGHSCHSNSYSLGNHIKKLLFPYRAFIDFHNGYIRLKPNMYYKYSNFKSQISFYKKEFPNYTLIIKKGRFYEIIGKDAEDLAKLNRLKPYYRKGQVQYGFRTNRIRKILYSMKAHYMSGVLIRETEEITNKIKARIPVYSWKLQRAVQLELFKTEERIRNEKK